jgi:hypothetical protein
MKESKRGSGGKKRCTKVHNFEEVSLPINCLRFIHKEFSTENIEKFFVLCFGVIAMTASCRFEFCVGIFFSRIWDTFLLHSCLGVSGVWVGGDLFLSIL